MQLEATAVASGGLFRAAGVDAKGGQPLVVVDVDRVRLRERCPRTGQPTGEVARGGDGKVVDLGIPSPRNTKVGRSKMVATYVLKVAAT